VVPSFQKGHSKSRSPEQQGGQRATEAGADNRDVCAEMDRCG